MCADETADNIWAAGGHCNTNLPNDTFEKASGNFRSVTQASNSTI